MNYINIMVGFPGAGKTTSLTNEMKQENSIILCPDEFRLELTGQNYYQAAEDLVWANLKFCASVLAKKYPITIDVTHLTVGSRAQWVNIAKRLNIHINCIWITTPYSECVVRNHKREKPVPDDVMTNMFENFEPPSYDEGFKQIYCVSDGTVKLLNEQFDPCNSVFH